MKTLVNKLWQLAATIESEKNQEFILFALALPEEAIAWDLIISARWIDADQQRALRYMVQKVQGVLAKAELRELSGILLFESDKLDTGISSMRRESGWKETNIDFFGKKVQEVYLYAAPVEELQVFASR